MAGESVIWPFAHSGQAVCDSWLLYLPDGQLLQ
jgi:hypothetical protein